MKTIKEIVEKSRPDKHLRSAAEAAEFTEALERNLYGKLWEATLAVQTSRSSFSARDCVEYGEELVVQWWKTKEAQ